MLEIAEKVRLDGSAAALGINEIGRTETLHVFCFSPRGLPLPCAPLHPPPRHPTAAPPPLPPPLQVRVGLAHLDPYFVKLADGMVAWIECWQMLNPAQA